MVASESRIGIAEDPHGRMKDIVRGEPAPLVSSAEDLAMTPEVSLLLDPVEVMPTVELVQHRGTDRCQISVSLSGSTLRA